MAYKARRTRDLQSEVKAGSGMSVTVQIKPDGTKEYTINNIAPGATVDGPGLSLIENILRNTMAARMGWSDADGSIDYRDDNNEPVLQIDPLEKIFFGDAKLGSSFFLKQLAPDANKLISGDVQIAEDESSTAGVSLQTLADNINSCCQYEIGCDYDNITNIFHIVGFSATDTEDYPQNSFYQEVTISNFHGYYGLEIKKDGIYRISIRVEITMDSSSDVTEIPLTLKTFRNGMDWNTYNYLINVTNANNGEYRATFSTSIMTNFAENDIFTFFVENTNSDITAMYIWGNDYIMNIQKIR